jgi:hypothetical protein
MTDLELSYLAGFFDGEGCIVLHKSRPRKKEHNPTYYAEACVASVDKQSVMLFKLHFGGNVYLRKAQTRTTRPIWAWQISAKQSINFFEVILPYLRLKKEQATIAFMFQKKQSYGDRSGLYIDKQVAAETAKKIISDLNKGRGESH